MAENKNANAKNNQNNTGAEVARNDALSTEHGRTVIEDQVVGKIAGLAAREVSGVHALGGGAARMLGSIRESFGASDNVQQGVDVEVGESQAAVDLSIVAEYGVAIHELAEAIRRNIIRAIERMTGLEVTEVNVTVTDVHLDLDDNDEPTEEDSEDAPRRVQ
ncbi:Asp23/Gls24 family envelope stress response protein [Corynebacterium sp. zg-331]|uniref:Asp23/Gls24 family envelope stress response protein n=1 Tax=unclassified Corynebacterium TaxID=2624378 RepID=UPI00128E8EC0|nr:MULTISPECIES: Asp23/Gls24 family envelope stress response protein [unclassified Corynebacterium]MBC3186051.1 Asp23/Gls24 family envelope stress response protein [Corynebacterium sp. zg-331]MPV52542.1 Asp23/Gls24 family envelope stress response protein [Corynebacterium sp. zg331]